jgi:hypothetical protein
MKLRGEEPSASLLDARLLAGRRMDDLIMQLSASGCEIDGLQMQQLRWMFLMSGIARCDGEQPEINQAGHEREERMVE